MNEKNNDYWLRNVSAEDKDLLLRWANDDLVRRNAFSQDKISDKQHEKWFRKALEDPNIVIYILMYQNMPVGQCRLDIDEEGCAEIDYSIDARMRGKGAGKILIKKLINEVGTSHREIKKLVGKVKVKNIASIKCFKDNDFVDSYYCYELDV